MTKWGWPPSASSNFSKNETSQVSPGLRHSSSWKEKKGRLFNLIATATEGKATLSYTERNAPEWRWCLCASPLSGHKWSCCQSTAPSPTEFRGKNWEWKNVVWHGNKHIHKDNLFIISFIFFQLPNQQRTHCNPLCLILLLLRSQGELNEQLLELLVAVVDAELLKTVGRNMR